MKQIEIEAQIIAIRREQKEWNSNIEKMLREVKTKKAAISMQICNLQVGGADLEMQRKVLQGQKEAKNAEFNAKIQAILKEHPNGYGDRLLCDVSDFALVNELRYRGFFGSLQNDGKSEDTMIKINKILGKCDAEVENENIS